MVIKCIWKTFMWYKQAGKISLSGGFNSNKHIDKNIPEQKDFILMISSQKPGCTPVSSKHCSPNGIGAPEEQ